MDANDESVTPLDGWTVDGWTVEDAEAILRTHNCRATGPRVAVLTALLRHSGPIDAGALTTLAQAEAAGIHEATVYRTISVLSDRGIVTHVHAGHGPSLVRLGGDHGLIAVCRDCGGITSVPADTVERFISEARNAIGFTLEPGHFALEGVCGRCSHDGQDGPEDEGKQ
ncbi:MAG: transcriptional repressor [Ilumatobacter sp.]|uniref:Fur family transcriptional regulator n=1 Tax=Ilumatobacter sp. TaxID=1967498 RepID=UPI003752CC76|nr:transcriptional repressor [Ilumatobacter sp.]